MAFTLQDQGFVETVAEQEETPQWHLLVDDGEGFGNTTATVWALRMTDPGVVSVTRNGHISPLEFGRGDGLELLREFRPPQGEGPYQLPVAHGLAQPPHLGSDVIHQVNGILRRGLAIGSAPECRSRRRRARPATLP